MMIVIDATFVPYVCKENANVVLVIVEMVTSARKVGDGRVHVDVTCVFYGLFHQIAGTLRSMTWQGLWEELK